MSKELQFTDSGGDFHTIVYDPVIKEWILEEDIAIKSLQHSLTEANKRIAELKELLGASATLIYCLHSKNKDFARFIEINEGPIKRTLEKIKNEHS